MRAKIFSRLLRAMLAVALCIGNDASAFLSLRVPQRMHPTIETKGLIGVPMAAESKNVNGNYNATTEDEDQYQLHKPSLRPAGQLCPEDDVTSAFSERKKRVLILCTGGTLTMDKDANGALAPVEGLLTKYLETMPELKEPDMPRVVSHEYSPLLDSSDMGPGDWAVLAKDIGDNYYDFDGFVVLTGTDTLAYTATAVAFMLESLGKPVIFTGSQIPIRQSYNDARKNLIMAIIFAVRDSIHEVVVFFHDRLLRAVRTTKVNTARLLAFDSPNEEKLAQSGITIEENSALLRPPPMWTFRVHQRMETRLITLRLIPGFSDEMMKHMIQAARETHLKGLILQLYGTGNIPSIKEDFVHVLEDAVKAGVVVVAVTQCHAGSIMMGHYATGQKLKSAGVVSGLDMTTEAASCKLAYLLGRGDLSIEEVRMLMGVNLRGELTPADAQPLPPMPSTYQQALYRQQATNKQQLRGVAPY